MSYVTYKLMHFLGIFSMLAGLAATSMYALGGGTRANNPYRRVIGATHIVAALLILVGGFGMLARIGVMHGALPGWVFLKLAIWGTLSFALAIPHLGPAYARALLVAVPLLALFGGAVALYKPF